MVADVRVLPRVLPPHPVPRDEPRRVSGVRPLGGVLTGHTPSGKAVLRDDDDVDADVCPLFGKLTRLTPFRKPAFRLE